MSTLRGAGRIALVVCLFVGCGDNLRRSIGETGILEVTPNGGLMTTESGGTASFDVVLTVQPPAQIIVTLASTNPKEGRVDTSMLTFDDRNWNVPQRVTVTGLDDDVADGDQVYAISLDAGENGSDDVAIANRDDDVIGVTATPTGNLQTSESGNTATFEVSLTSKPTANVTIPVTSSDPGEGTVAPLTLTFTPDTWNSAQTVTVTGVDDLISDANQTYTIMLAPVSSGDPKYNMFDPTDLALTNLDNDTANFFVSPSTGLQTTESGGTATFNVVLLSQPMADVTVPVSSNTPTEGTSSVSNITFTSLNWNSPREVTVTGQNDAVADGTRTYQIVLGAAVSADTNYAGRDPSDVSVSNLDNDTAGILVSGNQLTTTESGGNDVFTVVLLSQPTSPVTINVSSNDPTEGVASPTPLTFTATNWMTPQTVTVAGMDDAITDGDQVYVVALAAATSADAGYANVDPNDITVTNIDNEQAGITVFPTSGLFVSEFGDVDTFEVVLNFQPTSDVTITLTSSAPAEGTVFPASLTFTPFNWNTPQTVTVTGLDDGIADGDQVFSIITNPATSLDSTYALLDAANVTVTNVDDDSASVFVKARRRIFTSEDPNSQATFRVRLTTQPTSDVTCPIQSSDPSEGTVSPTLLTFTPANFAQFQLVTVIGVDDPDPDGDTLFTILLGACTSADPSYNGYDPRDVSVVNRDNE